MRTGEMFRILVVDVESGSSQSVSLAGRDDYVGGSGLAALLFSKYGNMSADWSDPCQPLIFTVGPLTGLFPLMSKMVCSFRSSYHNEYTESHAGGRAALALRFCGYDGLVILGKAKRLCCLGVSSKKVQVKDSSFMRGLDADSSGKLIRRMFPEGSGHRTILRIGPSGELGSSMACINVDTYRHFGRMGGGAIMGAKNIKGIVIHGDCNFAAPEGRDYAKLYHKMYQQVTSTDMMRKYHNLGTPANLQRLNDIEALPWNNLQKTSDSGISSITGTKFAEETLLRNAACAGCPVGCIHIGYIREKMERDRRYHYHQVAYDYEPIFAAGTMLGITNTFDILRILELMEKSCMDAMSAGVALAWATEATEQGLISDKETIIPLSFGDTQAFQQAAIYLGKGKNDFYRLLGQGTLKAAKEYGGEEFACVLGQEMAGYATGELFYAAQTLGFRHSHLDTGAYGYEQKNVDKDVNKAVDYLISDEPSRAFLTSMVCCLFARSVYTNELLADCLHVMGFEQLANSIDETSEFIRKVRWKTRIATGFNPDNLSIPKRFYSVRNWKGVVDKDYLQNLKKEYGKRILELAV